MDAVLDFLVGYAVQYPWFAIVISVVGTLRLVNKPLFALLNVIVAATKTEKDNEILTKVESSKIYKYTMFVLDYFTSVKIETK